ncbi:hypothetical protein HPB47_016088 [Ixodes persulcatus]|uniref:Uncharacterized protein n=1 Tax=Ixodes persulcatus TaxID=34615 RepID=A0AC60QVE4_IXOPE|nr:hypothetical protein HPB47_016088 [Ixodes persulcatus]
MRKKSLVRLVRAFVMSRLAYVIPFLKLGGIRKAYKRALWLPDSTSNEKVAALGLHNKIDELIEVQRTSQLERLTKSATGRHILGNLGPRYEAQRGQKVDVPLHIRETLDIPLLPRHIHPVHDTERRMARAKALKMQIKTEEGVIFADAAEYDKKLKAMMAVAVDREGLIIARCSVRTTETEVAEEIVKEDPTGLKISMSHVWLLKLHSLEAKTKLLEAVKLQVQGRFYHFVGPNQRELRIKIHWVTFDVQTDTVRRAFEPFGSVKEIIR